MERKKLVSITNHLFFCISLCLSVFFYTSRAGYGIDSLWLSKLLAGENFSFREIFTINPLTYLFCRYGIQANFSAQGIGMIYSASYLVYYYLLFFLVSVIYKNREAASALILACITLNFTDACSSTYHALFYTALFYAHNAYCLKHPGTVKRFLAGLPIVGVYIFLALYTEINSLWALLFALSYLYLSHLNKYKKTNTSSLYKTPLKDTFPKLFIANLSLVLCVVCIVFSFKGEKSFTDFYNMDMREETYDYIHNGLSFIISAFQSSLFITLLLAGYVLIFLTAQRKWREWLLFCGFSAAFFLYCITLQGFLIAFENIFLIWCFCITLIFSKEILERGGKFWSYLYLLIVCIIPVNYYFNTKPFKKYDLYFEKIYQKMAKKDADPEILYFLNTNSEINLQRLHYTNYLSAEFRLYSLFTHNKPLSLLFPRTETQMYDQQKQRSKIEQSNTEKYFPAIRKTEEIEGVLLPYELAEYYYCNAETFVAQHKGGTYFSCPGHPDIMFKPIETRSKKKVYEGEYATQTHKGKPYTMDITLEVEPFDKVFSELRRYGSNNGHLIFSDPIASDRAAHLKAFYTNCNNSQEEDKGWKKLAIQKLIPPYMHCIQIYAYNEGEDTIYFDNLKIAIYRQ